LVLTNFGLTSIPKPVRKEVWGFRNLGVRRNLFNWRLGGGWV